MDTVVNAIKGIFRMIGLSLYVVLLAWLFLTVYFIPTGVAMLKKRNNTGAIFILNLWSGWTIVGWFVALTWATKNDVSKVTTVQ